eukprot:5716210-Pyramimonas_sp.AAC.1
MDLIRTRTPQNSMMYGDSSAAVDTLKMNGQVTSNMQIVIEWIESTSSWTRSFIRHLGYR